MYVLDVRIEKLQTEIETLERINNNIDEQMHAKIDETIDAMRMVIDEQLEMLMEEVMMEVDLSQLDSMFESDIEDGLRENFVDGCLLYTSPSPRDRTRSRMPSSA